MKHRFRPHQAPRFSTDQSLDSAVATTLPVPGFRQTRNYTCGFASALMVLRYFRCDVSGVELFRRLGTGRDGTRQSALVREIRAAGLRANLRYDVSFPRIRDQIDRNKLIIGYLNDVEHWLVIYGYGLAPRRIFVADPRPGEPCQQPWDDYRERLGEFGIICSHPRDSVGLRQRPLDLVEQTEPERDGGPHLSPLPHLRCEVRRLAPRESAPEPAQLSLPFASTTPCHVDLERGDAV